MEISDSDGPRCFIDGSWKESNIFLGLGWFYFKDTEGRIFMGAMNL